jgi:hypothetical protein
MINNVAISVNLDGLDSAFRLELRVTPGGFKCKGINGKKYEPDERAECLRISLTASISRPDEVFGRDSVF